GDPAALSHRDDPDVAALHIKLTLPGLALVQRTAEEGVTRRLAVRALPPGLDESVAAVEAPDLHVFRAARQVHLHLVGDVLVEGLRSFDQTVAPALEVVDEPRAIDLEILTRHATHRSLDHPVADLGLQLERNLTP